MMTVTKAKGLIFNVAQSVTMRASECVLDVVFSRAKNGTAERASPTHIWQILK
jgi:hypothetical protein